MCGAGGAGTPRRSSSCRISRACWRAVGAVQRWARVTLQLSSLCKHLRTTGCSSGVHAPAVGSRLGGQHAAPVLFLLTWCGGMLRFRVRSSSVSFTKSATAGAGSKPVQRDVCCYGTTWRRRQGERRRQGGTAPAGAGRLIGRSQITCLHPDRTFVAFQPLQAPQKGGPHLRRPHLCR